MPIFPYSNALAIAQNRQLEKAFNQAQHQVKSSVLSQ
jgi:hypothetical protein